MKKLSFLFLLALLSTQTASAYEAEIDGVYYNFYNTEAIVTKYASSSSDNKNGYKGSIYIPETVVYYGNTYRVTTIGESAFAGCSDMTSVNIPSSVTSIKAGAFQSCSGLTSLTIPNSVTEIGERAFSDCSVNTSIIIPNSITAIGANAFARCSGEITINCNIPSASSYNYGVFYSSKFSSVTIGDDVESIGNGAFNGCSSITSLTIGNSVKEIGESAFSGCTGITSVNIPSSVTSVGGYAFNGCSGLTKVQITDIAAWCTISFANQYSNPLYNAKHLFMNDKEITEVVIPNSATKIGDYVFYNCSSLTSVVIPNSATTIGDYAFYNCSNLTEVTIPNGMTTIGVYAFYGCSNLISVDIPNSVTEIGRVAFYGCSGLKSMKIGKGLKEIGDGVFKGCTGDLTVNSNIPSESSYSKGVFYDTKFSSVTIGDDVESIGDNAFYLCASISTLTLGKNVTSIGNSAFYYCNGLRDIFCYAKTVPNTGKNALYNVPTSVVTLHVPVALVGAYKATSPWNSFVKYDAMDIKPEPMEKCATPTISFVNGELSFECDTEDVEFVSHVEMPSSFDGNSDKISLTTTCVVTVFAKKKGYEDSDVATKEIEVGSTAKKGDVNEDGIVNGTDIQEVINIIVNGENY